MNATYAILWVIAQEFKPNRYVYLFGKKIESDCLNFTARRL